jgi:hypothetical protein
MRKTEGVRLLVENVLNSLTSPYDEDLTDNVCMAIEANPQWLAQYRCLARDLGGAGKVNSAIGRYVCQITGFHGARSSHPSRSTLIKSYRKLDMSSQA